MLAFKSDGSWVGWTGQVLADTQYGAIIETAWSDDELAAIGLFRVADPGIPAGKVVASLAIVDVAGTPTIAYTLNDLVIDGSVVDAERERRIALPLPISLPDAGAMTINMDPNAQRNISGLALKGMKAIVLAQPDIVPFRDYANDMHMLTPADLIAMGEAAAARITTCYAKSWALKAMSPIPVDYADDSYWV